MHVVVLLSAGLDPAHALAVLLPVVGGTAFDLRPRIPAPGGGPSVLSRHPDLEAAEAQAEALRTAGLEVAVVAVDQPALFAARRVALEPDALVATDRSDARVSLPWDRLRAILLGTRVREAAREETREEVGVKVSIGVRTLLTGVPSISQTRQTMSTYRPETRELFVALVGADPTVLAVESELAADTGPDGSARSLTRVARLRALVDAVRERAPHAAFDQHLLQHRSQAQILGRSLPPAEHPALLVALRAMAVTSG